MAIVGNALFPIIFIIDGFLGKLEAGRPGTEVR